MTTPPPLPPSPSFRPPTASPWWRRLGGKAVTTLALAGGFLAVKVGPALFGYVFARSAISMMVGVKNRADPRYRAAEQGFRDAGLDPDSTLRALGKTVDSTWFFKQSALHAGTHLDGAELRELLAFRERLLLGLPEAACAAWIEGKPEASTVVNKALLARPDSELTRLTYLSVLAVARNLRDTTSIAPVSPPPDQVRVIFARYATPEELAAVDAYSSTDPTANSAAVSCAVGRAMYAAERRAPFPSADADALMALVVGR